MNMTNQKQRGAVLILALVMLMALTLIGVQSMSSSAVELQAASNAQQHNIAFQAAQSRLAFVASTDSINPIDYLIALDVTDPPSWPVQACNPPACPDGSKWVAAAAVTYLDCAKGTGSSLESGKGFSYRFFQATATGETTALTARSTQVGALRYPVKACGDEV